MEGYVTRGFGTNNRLVTKRSPLGDKTNTILTGNAKNVNEATKLAEMSNEKKIHGEAQGVTSSKLQGTNENGQPNKSTVNSNLIGIGIMTRHKTKSQNKLLAKEEQKLFDKEKVVICSSKQVRRQSNQKAEKSKDLHEQRVGFKTINKSEERHLLRKRNSKQNYAEESPNETPGSSSESDSLKTNNNRKNVPIYRRFSLLKEPNKKENVDVYELDISNDEDTQKHTGKRKKPGSSPNNSLPFERYMKVIVNKLEEKHKKDLGMDKKSHGKSKKVKRVKNVEKKKKEDKLLVSKKESCLKPGKPAGNNKQINQESVRKGSKVTEVVLCNFSTKEANLNQNECRTNINTSVNIISNIVIQEKYNSNIQERNSAREIVERKVSTVSDLSVSEANSNESESRSLPARNLAESHLSASPDIFDNGNEADSSDDENIDDLIPNENLSKIEKTRISDQIGPIANSTMVNNSFQGASSPWRLNLEVRRNPHFLQYKHSLLPNYNQEMVLDCSVIEKSFSKPSAVQKIVQPVQKQASILKYVSGGKKLENLDHINIECSLFNAHEFSPNKKISPKKKNSENKENISGNIKKTVESVKRNILGTKVDNIQNVTSPPAVIQSNNRSVSTDSSMGSDFFGFDNTESEIHVRDPNNKPFRMDPVIPKIIKAAQNIHPIIDECTEKKKKDKLDKEAYLKEIGLFEDYHPERNIDYSAIKQYKRRLPRRRRSPSPATTESEDEDYHKKQQVKRKKNLRTKEEEAEAEKWANEFNKMCEEVDKFPLEIE